MLLEASKSAAGLLGPNTRAARRLNAALEQVSATPDNNLQGSMAELSKTLDEIAKDLGFRVRVEAGQPVGFPGPTAVGEIEVKQYPGYRKALARTPQSLAFWTLFSHIKKNEIEMTAPVEMEHRSNSESGSAGQQMAFLYGDPSLGKPGKTGLVDVVDVPPTTVLSIGIRGEQSGTSLRTARRLLETWLETNQDAWVANGPYRTMAYNSPFVPREHNYFEIQIPILAVGQPLKGTIPGFATDIAPSP